MARAVRTGILCLPLICILCRPAVSLAFYSHYGDNLEVNLIGFAGLSGGVASYPEAELLYDEKHDAFWSGDARFIAEAAAGERLSGQLNLLQNIRSTPVLPFAGVESSFQKDVERSGLLYWQQHDSGNTQAVMVLDTAYFKYGNRSNELTVGRQPVSTSTTFFFTPNDFFAPFSANTFFKVYKPGVDALRYERRLALLSQLSVIGVLGYDPESAADSGWSNSPELQRSSLLARVTHTAGGFEWGALGGVVRESMVTGFSLQGELFQWLGVRTEGHYADSWGEEQSSGFILSVSLEHRFPSSLTVRYEQLYNGFGSDSLPGSLAERAKGLAGRGYLGRHYTAFDMSYQITPLLVGELLYLRNWSDDSSMLSVYGVYSLSDESDVALTVSVPGGSEPRGTEVGSEMGSLPLQIGLEYRHYF